MKKLSLSKKLLAATVASVAFSGTASAAYVDGIVSAGEYAGGTTLSLGFADDQGKTTGPIEGSFSFVTQGSYIYAALSAPTNFVDNVYGAPADLPGSGWQKGNSNSDSKKKKKNKSGHTFKDLLNSDKLYFDLNTLNGTKEIEFDYLNDSHESEITKGGSFIQDLATSLEYNLSHGCGDTENSIDFSDSSYDAGCTAVLTYEWKMDASLFAGFSAADFLNPTMHASPSKTGDHNFNPDCKNSAGTFADCPTTNNPNPPTPVSEPGSLALFLTSLFGLAWVRRARRKV